MIFPICACGLQQQLHGSLPHHDGEDGLLWIHGFHRQRIAQDLPSWKVKFAKWKGLDFWFRRFWKGWNWKWMKGLDFLKVRKNHNWRKKKTTKFGALQLPRHHGRAASSMRPPPAVMAGHSIPTGTGWNRDGWDHWDEQNLYKVCSSFSRWRFSVCRFHPDFWTPKRPQCVFPLLPSMSSRCLPPSKRSHRCPLPRYTQRMSRSSPKAPGQCHGLEPSDRETSPAVDSKPVLNAFICHLSVKHRDLANAKSMWPQWFGFSLRSRTTCFSAWAADSGSILMRPEI